MSRTNRVGPVTKDWMLEHCTIDPKTQCWIWQLAVDKDGYGRIRESMMTKRAHRVAYELWVGPIQQGMDVLHNCDNPPCFNPDHLFLGTGTDNSLDASMKLRNSQRFNVDEVLIIRSTPETGRSLAMRFGVTPKTISLIRNLKTYKWIA